MEGAPIDSALDRYPLLILSPGNATNVEFYASLAEDLASHGYVVAGLNHPFQVAAMELEDGSVAVYDHSMDSGQTSVVAKIDERLADIQFVLERLRQEVDSGSFLGGRVDLGRIGVLGHSNGGVTAAEMCRLSTQVAACLNIDGQAASGPFGTETLPSPVGQPFMYLTKETDIHPELEATFERSGQGTFRVVVPAATHEQFADGSLFVPSLSPFGRTVDRVHDVMRGMARAFFDRMLSQSPDLPLERIDAATDVFMYGYPLGANRLP
jgi:pimeloyl-ACP methyl ester carboxylesterase